jgi:hypothetical protein
MASGLMCSGCPKTTFEDMSTVPMTAPPAAANTPRAPAPQTTIPSPRGSTAGPSRHRSRISGVIRNVGIFLDTAARVVFLGRDGVRL